MKKLLVFALLVVSFSGFSASKSDDLDMEALADAKLKEMGVDTSEITPVKKHTASGFWTCQGIRLHMGVELTAWQIWILRSHLFCMKILRKKMLLVLFITAWHTFIRQ
ncbi:hypothetical protein ACFFW8_05500 [Erwinia tracheiphila]